MDEVKIPFNLTGGETVYLSRVWPGLVLEWKEGHLLLEFPAEADGISSAVYGGEWGVYSGPSINLSVVITSVAILCGIWSLNYANGATRKKAVRAL